MCSKATFVVLVYLGALAGEAAFLTYGILAVVPAGPFDARNLNLGIPLIVLGGIGVAGLAGALAGMVVASPLLLCGARCSDIC